MRIKLFLLSILVITFSLPALAKNEIRVSVADTSIVVDPLPGVDPDLIPRSSVMVPISADYEPFLSSVILSFSDYLGVIEVEVFNTSNGYYDSGFINTLFLSAVIPICGGPGHYIITFTLPSGQRYGGEFDV